MNQGFESGKPRIIGGFSSSLIETANRPDRMEKVKKTALFWALGVAITLTVTALYWVYPPALHRFELLLQNAHFQWRGPVKPGPEVVVAAIDEKSLDELGRWPWPRKTVARLVEKLTENDVAVIGFDLVFSSVEETATERTLNQLEEEIKALSGPQTQAAALIDKYRKAQDPDLQLAQVLRQSRRAVLGYFFHFEPEAVQHLDEETRHRYFENIRPAQFGGFIQSGPDLDLSAIDFRSAYAVESNVETLSKKLRRSGFISFDVEHDGSLRKLSLIVRYRDAKTETDYFFPPLSVRVLEKYLGGSLFFKVAPSGVQNVILDSAEPLAIPANEQGELAINFLGGRGTFPHISITDIVHDRKDRFPKGGLKDKIVLIGATATALGDTKVTPFDPILPGVEIHATVIDNILKNQVLLQPQWVPLADTTLLLVLGLALVFVYTRIRPLYGVGALLLISAALFFMNHWLFVHQRIFLTNVFLHIEHFTIFSGLMVVRYITEEKQKQFIQKTFSQYLSPKVIERIMKDPDQLKLGGEQKELTAFFTDLAGFTTFSEKLSPEELVSLLNEYFTAMTDILLSYEGTLDRYDGDAIKAFFGAPVYFADHATRACFVCIEMQERLAELRDQWKREGKPEIHMRVGLNTGLMVVGNMGTKTRMAYGMNGDSVNLAARLEGANKVYGTYSLISETTYAQAKEFIEVRELDSIRVVGRKNAVKIYELLGKKGMLDETMQTLLPLYNSGLALYKQQSWREAEAVFQQVLSLRPDDGPSQTLLKRCQEMKDRDPSESWDGVYTLTSK